MFIFDVLRYFNGNQLKELPSDISERTHSLLSCKFGKLSFFSRWRSIFSVATKSNEYNFPDRDRIDVKGTFLDQTKIREHVFSLNHDIYTWTQRAARSCVNVPSENILSPQKKSTVLLHLCPLVLWLFKIFLELNFFLGSEVHVRIDVCSFISAENKTFQIKQNQWTLVNIYHRLNALSQENMLS